MTVPRATATDYLQEILHDLPASGDKGFEGLMAHVLSRATGLVMRLANSGSQFGRDATTPAGVFAVAMEAKRYDTDLRLEDLAGKIAVAEQVLAGLVDLYVLGATSRISDQIEQGLREMLAAKGITLLTLDWTPHPLPPLAVAVAADTPATLAWFAANAPTVDQQRLQAALDEVRMDSAFAQQAASLRDAVSAASVGVEPLRRQAGAWLERRLVDAALSQEAFGQLLTVADPSSGAIPRPTQVGALATAVRSTGVVPGVVALLADEGMGKSWLVAQSWISESIRPIMLLVAGRRALQLDVRDPLSSIAILLAEQHGGRATEPAIAEWRQRLERWKIVTAPPSGSATASGASAPAAGPAGAQASTPAAVPRFVVVLDGLNERPSLPWADLVSGLAREVHALGGRLVVTCRPAFWNSEVRPRLRPELEIVPVEVAGYSDAELTDVLRPAGVQPAQLPPHVREFIRNPRVCRVATHVLQSLSVAPDELTVERLLLTYWQHRLYERGNLVAHNVADFHRLLREHARAWLEAPRRPFERHEWLEYSRVARIRDHGSLQGDLTEIEEGRFLTVTGPDSDTYSFRPEVLPFALALLLTTELRDLVGQGAGETPAELLARARTRLAQVLEPVRGFDALSDVVAAAVSLACLDAAHPDAGRRALILYWLELQNVSERAEASIDAAFSAKPDAFLDTLEAEDALAGAAAGLDVLTALLLQKRDDPRVGPALAAHLPRWLGRWAREDRPVAAPEWEADRRTRRADWQAKAWAEFTPAERTFVEAHTVALNSRALAADLETLATLVLAARPVAPHVRGLLAWGFARQLTADISRIDEDLRWVCRLNTSDPRDARTAASTEIALLGSDTSEVGRRARAAVLEALGDLQSHVDAMAVHPGEPGQVWTCASVFCDTDPYDPDALPPTNLDVARQAAASVEPSKVWVGMGRSVEDLLVEDALPGLTRFDPAVAVAMLRSIVITAPDREWWALRQLSWQLEALSPLFDAACVQALERVWDRLCADAELHTREQCDFVITNLSAALAPHRTPEVQLEQLLRLPAAVPQYNELQVGLKSVSGPALEQAIHQAVGDAAAFARVLLFASASRPELTDATRGHIMSALVAPHDATAFLAANTIRVADDSQLDDRLVEAALSGSAPFTARPDDQSYTLGRAVATVVVRRRRADALRMVSSPFLSAVVAQLGAEGDALLAATVDRTLARLVDPATPEGPPNVAVTVDVSADELSILRRLEDAEENPERSAVMFMQLSAEEADRQLREEQARRREVYRRFENELGASGANAMLGAPPQLGLPGLVTREPARVTAWVDALLAQPADTALRRAANVAYAIASAFSRVDAAKAAALFRHVDQVTPVVTVRIGREHLGLRDHALFRAAPGPAFDSLRRERLLDAFDDATIADATLAAELAGAGAWLDAAIGEFLTSDVPGHVARALTILGFRREAAQADSVFSRDWGTGFLGAVATSARGAYRRGQAAAHWLQEAAAATDEQQFWRALELAEAVADHRAWHVVPAVRVSSIGQRFDADIGARIERAAKKLQEARKKILFGERTPSRELLDAMRG